MAKTIRPGYVASECEIRTEDWRAEWIVVYLDTMPATKIGSS